MSAEDGGAPRRPAARTRIVGDLGEAGQPELKPIELDFRPPPMTERERRARARREREAGEPSAERLPVAIIIELNVAYPGGLSSVRDAFFQLFDEVVREAVPLDDVEDGPLEPGTPAGVRRISARLYQCVISRETLAALLRADAQREERTHGGAIIFKAWADYPLQALIDRSAPTVKADAARRSYAATGRRIVWAVMDTGIDATHPHFSGLPLHDRREIEASLKPRGEVKGGSPTFGLHRDFTWLVDERRPHRPAPLTDESGHGTHVAGIIAGRCPASRGTKPWVATSYVSPRDASRLVTRAADPAALMGMAPDCSLVSLKVMQHADDGLDHTSASALIRAIDYIQNEVNAGRGPLQIHGVNISIGCEWLPQFYAAGRSPLCQAIDQLVASGVVVVISAGNSGTSRNAGDQTAVMGSITEPGHTEDCITVGSTHRDSPHSFGITYTSSKGPTLDGRRKPDVVAPGEWIASAATGRMRSKAGLDPGRLGPGAKDPDLTYAEESGTSMSAPHVSGVIAAFLSARPEFIGRPREVKRLLLESATDLAREPYAQGRGLVDLMRMLSDS